MKDLNFFESYVAKKEFIINKQLLLIVITILIITSILFYSISNEIKIRQISKEIEKLKTTANDERINKKVNEIIGKKEEVKEFKENLMDIKNLDEKIEDSRVIDYYFLDIISSKMPDGIFFTSFNIKANNIEIIGVAENEKLVADFGKNIEMIEKFEEVFISNISKVDQYYKFILNVNLEDVSIGEEDEFDEE